MQVQFYNQGEIYTDCNSLIFKSGGWFPSTSVFEINSYSSVPLSKIVIGKPLDVAGAANGYMSAETLNSCVKQATKNGWNGGVMYWEWQKSLATLSMMAVIA
jgi:chitinase